jgi:O-antigen ligase/tetratricopeptide (TPR) repeat protein
MEAGWLAAVIVVPVFFNVYSSRIFEPDKITLLRTLALVILAAWLIKLFEEGGARWERVDGGESRWKALLRVPLIAPTLALALVYLIATVISVTPRVSLWGSYQRLQGTYSTFAYLVVFAAMVANLRSRAQVERLIGAAILASLPVSLYGVVQHFGIDPIPWGGDVTSRVAANMGNSIFVSAYLIMVFPLAALRIVESFEALLTDRGRLGPNFARSTGYVFIGALQLIAIYFSGSRGPWLGWGVSLIFIYLGLSLVWRARWLTISGVVLVIAASVFLLVLNIPGGPLESLRATPEFGRLGRLLDAESRTGRVRTLIWEGAAELVSPHQPLEYPDGHKDTFNFLRPLIGYGPESMYVAYNPFYPPELTQVERRNASPDRSHNETWDSLVITGVLGLAAYLFLFGSVLYYGFKWLGMGGGKRQRNLFLGLVILGGVVSSTLFVAWRGIAYLGVALPSGMILGVVLYLVLASLFSWFNPIQTAEEKLRAYVLLGLLAAVAAHWVEINFGIAIAATRTYFWVYTGLLLLVGYLLPLHGAYSSKPADAPAPDEAGAKKADEIRQQGRGSSPQRKKGPRAGANRKRRRSSQPSLDFFIGNTPAWLREALIAGTLTAVVLVTLDFNYITNAAHATQAIKILWDSLTFLPGPERTSYGILALVVTAWLLSVVLLVSESMGRLQDDGESYLRTWGKMLGMALGTSAILGLIFGLWHSGALASLARTPANSLDTVLAQVRHSESLLTNYYVYLFLVVFSAALWLPVAWPASGVRAQPASAFVSLGAVLIAFVLGSYTNLRVIQADIAFKTADLFSKGDTWPVAIAIYNHANDLAPNEDYYYLFLGRAYLEQAKTLQDATERERLIARAAEDLRTAQKINPLNTDHTANLARLYSLWATYTQDAVRNRRNFSQER